MKRNLVCCISTVDSSPPRLPPVCQGGGCGGGGRVGQGSGGEGSPLRLRRQDGTRAAHVVGLQSHSQTEKISSPYSMHDTVSSNRPSVLDSFTSVSGHMSTLMRQLGSEKIPSLHNRIVLPLQVSSEKDFELEVTITSSLLHCILLSRITSSLLHRICRHAHTCTLTESHGGESADVPS